jgi:CheY-like chemotaxis protein
VNQILTFSRQAETERVPVQPAVIVKESIRLLRSSIPSTISIQQDINPKTDLTLADPTQIYQIIMNLCTNAYHAMEETGGTLSISLKNITLTDHDMLVAPHIRPGNFVRLSIKDTGAGIEPEIINKIFDPYFTTKETGKGTGMGLAITHGIIKSYGGFITCRSEVGAGTVFDVSLPALSEQIVPETEALNLVPMGTERILFIDDEPILVEMSKDMLSRLGYSVTVRTNSLEALTTFEKQPEAFDLVITDQTMPGITGFDLARRMLQIRPNLPIILCTGHSSLITEEKVKSFGIKGFTLKPLIKKDIAGLIRKVLDEGKNFITDNHG